MPTYGNNRNERLYTASTRVTGATVAITTGAVSSIVVPKNTTTPVPSSVVFTASASGYTSPAYAWAYRFGTSGSFTSLSETTNVLTVTTNSAWLTSAGTNTVVEYQVTVTETAAGYTTGVNSAVVSKQIPILREGQDGTSGLNSAVVVLYKRTTTNTTPTVDTTSNSTYTFASGQVVGQPSGWTQTIPSNSGGAYLWTIQVLAASITSSYVFANTQWSSPVLYSQDGSSGTNGYQNALVYAYKRSASTPTDNPTSVTYDFTTGTIVVPSTNLLTNDWYKSIPSGTDPLYVVVATASSNTNTQVATSNWSTPVILAQNGANGAPGSNGTNGYNSATIYLYARNDSITSAPTFNTSGTSRYTFASAALVQNAPVTGWTSTIPDSTTGSVLWVRTKAAVSTASFVDFTNDTWGDPVVLSQKGDTGNTGKRGSRQLYSTDATYSNTWIYNGNSYPTSFQVKATDLIAAATAGSIPTTPIEGDTVTFSNGSTYVYTLTYTSNVWSPPGTVIDGSLLVTGSVTASKINSNGLSVRASDGSAILEALADTDATFVGTGTLRSTTYTAGSGTTTGSGWKIDKTGNATFENATIRGIVYASSGQFSGSLSGANIEGATGIFTGTISASSLQQSKTNGVSKTYYNTSALSDYNGTTYTISGANPYIATEYDLVGLDKLDVRLQAGGGGGGGGTTNGSTSKGAGAGGGGGALTVATLTLTNNSLYTISAISAASTCRVTTSTAHNLSTGDRVTFKDVTGGSFTNLNKNLYWVTVISSTQFDLYTSSSRSTPVSSSTWGTFTSGSLWPRIDDFTLVTGCGGAGAVATWGYGQDGGGTYIQQFKNGSGTAYATYAASAGKGAGPENNVGAGGGTYSPAYYTYQGTTGSSGSVSDTGGAGGGSPFGSGTGGAGGPYNSPGVSGTGYGAGGGGAGRYNGTGGAGTGGKAYVEFYSSKGAVTRAEFNDLIAQLTSKLGFSYTPYSG